MVNNRSDKDINNIEYFGRVITADRSVDAGFIKIFIETSDSIISQKNRTFPYPIVKKQYEYTKILYDEGLINKIYFIKFYNFHEISKLRFEIDGYLTYFEKNNLDENVVLIIIDELKKACDSELILELNDIQINKINRLLNIITNNISKSPSLRKSGLNIAINDLIENHLSPTIGYSSTLQREEITISISPVDNSFKVKDINFEAEENKNIFKKKRLQLNNNHITSLKIDEMIYGIDGCLQFDLSHPISHPDFEFLTNKKQLIHLDIKITSHYNFLKKGSKTENHSRSSRFHALGHGAVETSINRRFASNIFTNEKSNIHHHSQSYSISFEDPLKALWKIHKPTYIDFKKSIVDIFQDNFFFDDLLKIDASSCSSLQERSPQVFISTTNRTFYDFFIEQLSLNKCALKYYIGKEDKKVTYYIADDIDGDFKNFIKNSQNDIQQEFHAYDTVSFINQTIEDKSPEYYVKQTLLIPDINCTKNKTIEANYDGDGQAFESIYNKQINDVNYLQRNKVIEARDIQIQFKVCVDATYPLPFINSEIDLSTLSNKDVILGGESAKELYLSQRTLVFKKSKYAKKTLLREVTGLYYKSDSDADCYEKIVFCSILPLTHENRVTYVYKSNSRKSPEYPAFKKFNSFELIGRVTIGKNVGDDSKKTYKFFKNYKLEETGFSEFQEGEEKGTDAILNSKRGIYYAVEITPEILAPKCSEDPQIYVPINININSAVNQFMPLRNDDIVKVSIDSSIECHCSEIISNSAISTAKAQTQFLQRHLLGAKENCEVAYTQENEDETYSIKQQNKKNDNSIFLHNKNGIFLTYKAKED